MAKDVSRETGAKLLAGPALLVAAPLGQLQRGCHLGCDGPAGSWLRADAEGSH